eukprot:2147209-Rhodomonas_salina.1
MAACALYAGRDEYRGDRLGGDWRTAPVVPPLRGHHQHYQQVAHRVRGRCRAHALGLSVEGSRFTVHEHRSR